MQSIVGIIVALIVGALGGYWVADSRSVHPTSEHKAETHTHEMLVEAESPIPTIALTVHEDPKGGYNAEIVTTNFRFAPEHVSTAHVPGEGHAHIYVDGVKINRMYGNWYALGTVSPGEHEIRVDLSTNDHGAYAVNGEKISSSVTLIVPEGSDSHMMMENQHDSMEMEDQTHEE